MADMHSFGEKMVSALCWIHRSYETSPEGQTYNEKFEFFGWGGYESDDISPEFLWKIESVEFAVSDARWNATDHLKMRVRGGALKLEKA